MIRKRESGTHESEDSGWFDMVMIAEIEQRVVEESCELLFLERSRQKLSTSRLFIYISLEKLRTLFIFLFSFPGRLTPTVYIYPKTFPYFYMVTITTPFVL